MKTKSGKIAQSSQSNTATISRAQPFFQKTEISHKTDSPISPIQTKLKTGQAGDRFEMEADSMADVVTGQGAQQKSAATGGLFGQISPFVQTKEESDISQLKGEEEEETMQMEEEEEAAQPKGEEEEESLQSKGEEEEAQTKGEEEEESMQMKGEEEEEAMQMQEEEEEEMQMQEEEEEAMQAKPSRQQGGRNTTGIGQKLRSARGGGSPLSENVRAKMEQGFGADFSGVRIHTDSAAVEMTRQLRAQAFANGRDIYFNDGRFSPTTRQGEHLLAHELTHTIQQGAVDPMPSTENQATGTVQFEEDSDSTISIRPELLEAIRLARREIGQVDAKKLSAEGTRIGWERLYEYFFTAFGGKEVIHKDIIKYIKKLKDEKGNEIDMLPSWCGIFVWWAYKQAGIPIPDWKLGVPILNEVVARAPGELPQKGDIAYRDKFQHFALVTGVEDPATAEGKEFKSVLVATVNGNTSGEDNLGGQIEEKWEPIGKWAVFMNPVAKLDMPDVPLVQTSVTPDAVEEKESVTGVSETDMQPVPESSEPVAEEINTDEPEFPTGENTDVPVELPEVPPTPPQEETVQGQSLSLQGSSDEAMVGFSQSNPSDMAATFPSLGQQLDGKMGKEQQEAAATAPKLKVETKGKVEEGITPPDQLGVPGEVQIQDGVTGTDPGNLEPGKHENKGNTPDNKQAEKELDKKDEGGFLSWFKNNFKSFFNKIKTKDAGLNTKAGERPEVEMKGEADAQRMQNQKEDADKQLKGQRDKATEKFKNHPGQSNIQPKAVNEEKAVELSTEKKVVVETQQDPGMADYATAALPADVRKKSDEMMKPQLEANLSESTKKTKEAATKRNTDKDSAINNAKEETKKINEKADKDQKDIVIANRGKVAEEQKAGIKEGYDKVNEFNTEADKEQVANKKLIGDKVKEEEGKAKTKLEEGEKDADKKKLEGEKEAAAEKEKLDKEQKKQGFWDRVASAIKKAVKAITAAIDKIFTKIREAVKTIIEKAKNAAIGLINAARNWVIDKLNKFRDWAKGMVDKYLKEHFPALAERINKAIDVVVDVAIVGVNAVADTAIAGVEALAKGLTAALDKILEVFQTALKAAVAIAGAVLTGDFAEALKIAIQAACDIAGIDSKPIFDFIDRAAGAVMTILKSPLKFFGNLIAAIGGGARAFFKNIKKHLISGLIGWLTGALSEVALTLPDKFDVKGIFSLVMQILGLTFENIKAKIIKRFPPAAKVFGAIEKGFAIIKKLVVEGPIALWNEMKSALVNFKEMVLGGIRDFVITTVIKEAVTWLLGLLNPAGALVKALKLLFDFVMFLVERFQQIKDFVMSVYTSLSAIAAGKIGQAVKFVEDAMARSLPVIISLLASLAGLRGIGKTVQNIIQKISKPVQKMLNKIIDKVVKFAKKLLKKGKKAAKKIKDKIVQWWTMKKPFKGKDGKPHKVFFKGKGKKAKLMIASEVKTYSQFVAKLSFEASDPDRKKKMVAKTKAIEIAGQIDDIIADPAIRRKTNADAEIQERVQPLLNQLAEKTEIFAFTSTDDQPPSLIEYGPINGEGGATYTNAKILSKNRVKGSEPQDHPPIWQKANRRKTTSVFIRGHLLNHNIGGPGYAYNLTPITGNGAGFSSGYANRVHLDAVESKVKPEIDKGNVLRYKIKAVYGKHSERTFQKTLNARIGTAEEKPDDKKRLEIMEYEQNNLPLSLNTEWAILKNENGKWVDDVVKTPILVLNMLPTTMEFAIKDGKE